MVLLEQNNKCITILCSGICLGVYIPALILYKYFIKQAIWSDIHVLESYWQKLKQDDLLRTKSEFHKNFKLALMGQKMSKNTPTSFDNEKVNTLLSKWKTESRSAFLVFSGFWSPILKKYAALNPDLNNIDIKICHMDSACPPSWKMFPLEAEHIHLFDWETNQINQFINVCDHKIIPFDQRLKSYLIHGGGWGLGTYLQKIKMLNQLDIPLDVVVYENQDLMDADQDVNRFFMIDPAWKAWEKNELNEYEFPPFHEINSKVVSSPEMSYPNMFDLTRQNLAIISKPGGSTLNDSLAAATPIIFLEPYGEHEHKNALLWEKHGLGIPFQAWMDQGCPIEPIERAHQRLVHLRTNLSIFQENYLKSIGVLK